MLGLTKNKKIKLNVDEIKKLIEETDLKTESIKISFNEKEFDKIHYYPVFNMVVLKNDKTYILADELGTIFYEIDHIKDFLYSLYSNEKLNSIDVKINPLIPTYSSMYNQIIFDIRNNPFKDEPSLATLIKDLDLEKLQKVSSVQINELFINFCCEGNFHCLKQLCESTYFSNIKKNIDIAFAFHRACSYDYLEVVKYLYESKEQLNFNKKQLEDGLSLGVMYATANKRIEVLDYIKSTGYSFNDREIEFLKETNLMDKLFLTLDSKSRIKPK